MCPQVFHQQLLDRTYKLETNNLSNYPNRANPAPQAMVIATLSLNPFNRSMSPSAFEPWCSEGLKLSNWDEISNIGFLRPGFISASQTGKVRNMGLAFSDCRHWLSVDDGLAGARLSVSRNRHRTKGLHVPKFNRAQEAQSDVNGH